MLYIKKLKLLDMFLKTKIYITGFLIGLFFSIPVSASTFYFSPESSTIIKGCNKSIDILMDVTGGKKVGAAQFYVNNNSGVGTITLNQGSIFDSYGKQKDQPTGRYSLYGFGGNVGGLQNVFGQLILNVPTSIVDGTKINLEVFSSNTADFTTKIIEAATSENIFTGVNFGEYTVISGYCETALPYLSNMNPAVGKPNHPVSQDITFDLKDDGSGVDISTLSVTLKQNGVDVPFVLNTTKVNAGDDKIYSVNINPNSDLIREVRVDVTVSAQDKAGNLLNRSYSFNDLTCEQLGCFALPPTCSTTTVTNTVYVGIENNTTSTEYITTTEYVTTTITQNVSDPGNVMPIHFYLDNRSVEAVIYNDEINTLSGSIFTVAAETLNLNETVNSAKVILEGKEYPMFYDNTLKMYSVDISDLVTAGFYQARLQVNYGADKTINSGFTISVLNRGYVSLKTTTETKILPGAFVTLQKMNNGNYETIKKITTDVNGSYGFVVTNGNYRLVFEATNFEPFYTSGFSVTNNIINRSHTFIEKINLLDPTVTLGEKADYVVSVVGGTGQQIIDVTNNPQVEEAVQNYAAPIALGAALAATAPALSLLNLLSYLRFLFLQPIFLLGMRRRKKWGVIYNSLSKMPVDLAVVRLLDANTNKVVQSRVTDAQGRYVFLANPGTYRIVVEKQNLIFPSKILQDEKEDTTFLDIYHGEIIHVDEKYTVLSANIPLDLAGAPEKTPRRIIWDKHWKDIQKFIAGLSIVAGIVAVIIAPSWWTIALLVSQVLLYFLFKRSAIPKKPKSWGIVYDKDSKKPVGKAMARLFSKQFNKLVLTEITDSSGRYSFMVGPNEYYVTFDKDGYQKATTGDIRIKEKDEVIKVDTGMEKIK